MLFPGGSRGVVLGDFWAPELHEWPGTSCNSGFSVDCWGTVGAAGGAAEPLPQAYCVVLTGVALDQRQGLDQPGSTWISRDQLG